VKARRWPQITDPKAQDYPIAEQFNGIRKYVATHRPESLRWNNSVALGSDPVAKLRELKQEAGPDLLTQGSSNFIQTLFAQDHRVVRARRLGEDGLVRPGAADAGGDRATSEAWVTRWLLEPLAGANGDLVPCSSG
jgi:hypothetical protein